MEDSSDPCITRVGFGGWAIDGSGWSFGWSPEDDSDAIAAVRLALDLGDDWIDTSAVHGLDDSEGAGAYLGDARPEDRPYVLAKCGLILEEGHRAWGPRQSRWPASIRQECEASLRRLGVERIDLYRLCWPDVTSTHVEDSRLTVPSFAPHRLGLIWYSPREIDVLTETLSQATTPASAVAVTWTLTSRGVAGAIVSPGSAGQIEGWIDAVTLVLSRANLGEIVSAIGQTGAGRGPQLPAELAA